ncbi:hypothetical protein BaRGS_00007502 [Batillaria attramentaria]|uniref:Uncharacterized protein n=1 Tax=Batillaria attramentaria TaxID=370345 RepID=A0ABD0LP67_9CAEN
MLQTPTLEARPSYGCSIFIALATSRVTGSAFNRTDGLGVDDIDRLQGRGVMTTCSKNFTLGRFTAGTVPEYLARHSVELGHTVCSERRLMMYYLLK